MNRRFQNRWVHAFKALRLEPFQRRCKRGQPVGFIQLRFIILRGGQPDHQRGLLRPAAQFFAILRDLRDQLAERGAAEALFRKIGAQAHQRILQFAGVHLLLFLIFHDGFHLRDQFIQIAGRAFPLLLGLGLLRRHGFQKHKFIAGVDEYARSRFGAGNAQHEFAHAFQFSHQRRIIAVAGYDAEGIDQRIGIRDLHGVDHQRDI